MSEEVLTIKEVAALLKFAEKMEVAMAQAGKLPAFHQPPISVEPRWYF